jgi:hypothetical protein
MVLLVLFAICACRTTPPPSTTPEGYVQVRFDAPSSVTVRLVSADGATSETVVDSVVEMRGRVWDVHGDTAMLDILHLTRIVAGAPTEEKPIPVQRPVATVVIGAGVRATSWTTPRERASRILEDVYMVALIALVVTETIRVVHGPW